jgi:hypothetical protein
MRIVSEHVYDCSPEVFWAHHLDEESRRAKEIEGCGAVSFGFLSKGREGDAVVVHAEMVEAADAPAPVRRIFGETTRVEETLRWVEGSNTATVAYRPDTMSDRVRMSGRLTTEPLADGRCKVVLDVDVSVKLLGVGGMVERLLAKQLPLRQEKAMSWFNANLGS